MKPVRSEQIIPNATRTQEPYNSWNIINLSHKTNTCYRYLGKTDFLFSFCNHVTDRLLPFLALYR